MPTNDNISVRQAGRRGWTGVLLAAVVASGCATEEYPEVVGKAFQALDDPSHVSFTLEGCRNNGSITLPNGSGKFICPDAAYTTGNLGKGWNELDLVPHRFTAQTGNASPATQAYTIAIAVDNEEAGHPGYDVLSAPELNTALSDASCSPPVVGAQMYLTPGIGGTDTTLYRLVNITQDKKTTCVYDYYARLALGSHLFPGSSLHANLTNQNLGTAGIGAKDVSIPVKEILPQELAKDMSASQGTDHIWNITKQAQPATVTFADTCSANSQDRQAPVTLTVSWQKLPATPSGPITVMTNIYATNPAHRTITVEACDDIRSGTNVLDHSCFAGVDVPANTTMLVATHSAEVPAGSTDLNDVATATYIDKDTGIPVPGQTTATASALVQLTGPELNQTATILDAETITGAGLQFSADGFTGASGAFQGYTPGTPTAPGPVSWLSSTQSGDGSVIFDKTIYVDVATITSGTLSDTATLTGSNQFVAQASASVNISSNATVALTINKSIPNVLSGAEQETFCFEVKSSGGAVVASPKIAFSAGETSNSAVVSGLAPDSYTVTELPMAQCPEMQSGKWLPTAPQVVNLNLDRGCQGLDCCSSSVSFSNNFGPASARVRKVTIPAGAEAGWEFTLKKGGVAVEQVTTTGTGYVLFTTQLEEGSYTIEETLQPFYEIVSQSSECSFTVDYPNDADRLYSCTFTNRFIPEGKIAPTQTTCEDFTSGSAADLTEVGYGAKNGLINNVAPGVFFYYTKLKAPGPACFTIDVVQQVNPGAYSPAYLFAIQQAPSPSQVKLYDAACATSGLGTVSFPSQGQAQIVVCGAAADAELIVSVKYEANSIAGLADPAPTMLHYDFSTNVNGNPVDFDIDGLDLVAK